MPSTFDRMVDRPVRTQTVRLAYEPDNAEKLSTSIRDNSIDELMSQAQDFGRRQPAVFLGAAALLGFAASRFLLASANRSNQTVPESEAEDEAGYMPEPNGLEAGAGSIETGRT